MVSCTIVNAEIPDPAINPKLHEVVTCNNIHGPCGLINTNSLCMEGRGYHCHCTKNFAKPCHTATVVSDDSYNPLLSLRYKAHINAEVIYSVQAVKYLYKYITKGQDRIIMSVRDEKHGHVEDEVENYMNACYISASKALWKIYEFLIHKKHPPVEKLPCHLPNQQQVLFAEHQVEQVVQQGPPVTTNAYFHITTL